LLCSQRGPTHPYDPSLPHVLNLKFQSQHEPHLQLRSDNPSPGPAQSASPVPVSGSCSPIPPRSDFPVARSHSPSLPPRPVSPVTACVLSPGPVSPTTLLASPSILGSQPSPIEESAPPPCPSLPPTLRPNLPPTEFVAPPPPPAVASSAPPGFSPPPVASEPLVAPPLPLAHQSPRRPGIPIPEYDSDYTSSSHSPIDHTRAAKFVGLQSEDWLAKPATAPPKQREESEEQARCRTIAQRMAKLGGIKLGMPNAPPPAPTHKSA
ncbi:hypothetical protein V565_200020, partial [Rhizoctonia solani 123E]